MKDVQYISGAPGTAAYTTYDTSNSNSRVLNVKIPSGKVSLMTNITTKSVPSGDYNVSYAWDNTGQSWVCRDTISPAQNALSSVPKNWIITLATVSGTQKLSSSFKSYRGTSGEFSNVEMYLASNVNSLVNSNQFISGRSSTGQTLYLGDGKYSDYSQVKLKFNSDAKIYDFSLYMNTENEKVYISSDGFADPQELEKWSTVSGVAEYITVYENYDSDSVNNIPVFEKGQFIDYKVTYDDYEADPSKSSYWRYTHTPMNDGINEQASFVLDSKGNVVSETGIILSKPIDRFYVDGKYTVEHWQTDDTTRGTIPGGNCDYDKDSNIATYTFYIRGDGETPWIRYIKTDPSKPYEGDDISLIVDVDDDMKESLSLYTEVYRDGEMIFSDTVDDINPDEGGDYIPVKLEHCITSAQCGTYNVFCSVSDAYGTGFDTYAFTVTSKGFIAGFVYHTDKWEENRKRYNLHMTGSEYNDISDAESYLSDNNKLSRGRNVFWSGEKIMLEAISEGNPEEVKAWVEGYEDILTCVLTPLESDRYRGQIWCEDFNDYFGSEPQLLKIYFASDYGDGNIMIDEEEIIIDNSCLYWQLHKTA